MGPLVKLGLIGAGLGGAFYFGEYKPAQERKRKKEAVVPTPTPTPLPPPPPLPTPLSTPGEVIYVGSHEFATTVEQSMYGRPVATFLTMRKGDVYGTVKPVVDELAAAYPEIQFFEFDMAQILPDIAAHLGTPVPAIQTDVVQFNGGVMYALGQAGDGSCVRAYQGPQSFEEQLAAAGEKVSSLWECSSVEFSDLETLIGQMVWVCEVAIEAALAPPVDEGTTAMRPSYPVPEGLTMGVGASAQV